MMIFDTHAHYDDEQFDEDREELLNSMQTHGVGGGYEYWVQPCRFTQNDRTDREVSICLWRHRRPSQ